MRCSLRVMPASSPVLAARLPIKVLMSVDLPTLGMPQISTRMGLTMPPRRGASSKQAAMMARAGRGDAGVERDGTRVGLRVVVGEPERGALGIGHVLLVDHFQRGLATGELGQQRVGAGARQACIEHLDDDVDVFHALGDRLARQVHVPGEPLDAHGGDCALV